MNAHVFSRAEGQANQVYIFVDFGLVKVDELLELLQDLLNLWYGSDTDNNIKINYLIQTNSNLSKLLRYNRNQGKNFFQLRILLQVFHYKKPQQLFCITLLMYERVFLE